MKLDALTAFASSAALAVLPMHALAQGVGQFTPEIKYVAANRVSADMGRCVLGRDRRRAVGLVETQPGSPAFTKLANEIDGAMVSCLKANRSATVSVYYSRAAIAEALLLENNRSLLTAARSIPAVAPSRITPLASEGETVGSVFACAVRANPTAAADLISAESETPAEMAAFRTLLPAVQSCVPATGAVKIKPAAVRPNTALALYELRRGSAR